MGTKTTLANTPLAAAHVAAAQAAGQNATAMMTQVQSQLNDAVALLKQLVKTMQAGDTNIALYNSLIANLS